MNPLDIGVVAVIVLSAIFAFARGFVREALSIIAWVGAAAITLYGFNHVYGLVLRFVTTPLLANLRPSGKYLMEDFYYAGGLRALLSRIPDLLDTGCGTITGKTLAANEAAGELPSVEGLSVVLAGSASKAGE